LISGGFLPDPATFQLEHPAGYGGHPLVFALEQTTLSPDAEPNKLLYVCIIPGIGDQSLFCLLSKVPLFEFHFRALEELREMSDIRMEAFVQRLVTTSALQSEGVLDSPPVAAPTLSWSTTGEHAGLRSAAAWALSQLLKEFPQIIDEGLVTLLARVLQEPRLIIVGQPHFANWIALLLRSLLQPYKWLHLFLPASLPVARDAARERVELEQNPFPMIIVLPHLPSSCQSIPEGVLVAELGPHGVTFDEVPPARASLESSTTSRLYCCFSQIRSKVARSPAGTGSAQKLPGHEKCSRRLQLTMQQLQQRRLGSERSVEIIQKALEAEVETTAAMIRRYAQYHAERSQPRDVSLVFERISTTAMFAKWLSVQRRHRDFYKAHFATQISLDLLHRELASRMPRANGADKGSPFPYIF